MSDDASKCILLKETVCILKQISPSSARNCWIKNKSTLVKRHLGLRPASERRRYNVTPSLIGSSALNIPPNSSSQRAQLVFLTVCLATSNFDHYNDVIITTIASQITYLTVVYSIAYSNADQRKHQSSASLAFVRGIHRGPVNSPHKWPVTRKMFPFDDVIMLTHVGLMKL